LNGETPQFLKSGKMGEKEVDRERNNNYTLYQMVETLNLLYQLCEKWGSEGGENYRDADARAANSHISG
jgi:hypothetical protein